MVLGEHSGVMNNNTEPGSSPETPQPVPTTDPVAPDVTSTGARPEPEPTATPIAGAGAGPAHVGAASPPGADATHPNPGQPGTGYPNPDSGHPSSGAGYQTPGYSDPAFPGSGNSGYQNPGYADPTYSTTGYPGSGYPGSAYPGAGSAGYGAPATQQPAGPAWGRRLTRSRQDRVLSGVCGGLARYWNTDALLLRILLIVVTLATGGAALLGYLIAWLVIPQDDDGWPGTGAGFASGGNPAYGPGSAGGYVPPSRPRSYLGLVALSASILVAGILGMIGVFFRPTVDFGGVIVTSMLLVLGIAMIVGAWYGRARWLAFFAVPLVLISMGAIAAQNVLDNPGGSGQVSVGTRQWNVTPQDVGNEPLSYQVTAGDATLDLTALTANRSTTAPTRVTISARVGLGQLIVRIPADMQLNLDASLRAGQVLLPGETQPTHDGTDISVQKTLAPTAGTQPAYIVTLDANLGAGNLEVHRDAA